MTNGATFIDDWLQEKWNEGLTQGRMEGLNEGLALARLEGMRLGYRDGQRDAGRSILWRVLRTRFGNNVRLPLDIVEVLDLLPPSQLEALVSETVIAPDEESFFQAVREMGVAAMRRIKWDGE